MSLERTSMGLAGQLELARNAARRLLEIDLRPSRKLTLTRVELARRIPAFAEFLATCFGDGTESSNRDLDVDLAERFVRESAPETTLRVLREGEELKSFSPFPAAVIESEGNRHFDGEVAVAREWLESVLGPFRAALESIDR